MSDSEEETYTRGYEEITKEINKYKSNPTTAGMFVSGWDDPEAGVDSLDIPAANPLSHTLWAAEHNELDVLRKLVATHPEVIHEADADGYTALHRAAYGNHVAIISYLLSVGADVNKVTLDKWTPLHSACNWNNYAAVARLLAGGADIKAVSEGDQTPLHLASAISHCKSTLLLLLLRDDIVCIAKKPNKSQDTPEQLARTHGIYAPLFEMAASSISYIRSLEYTSNPYLQKKPAEKVKFQTTG